MSSFRPALMVVDMQNGFITDGSQHVVPVVTDLTRRWHAAGGHVVLTRYRNYPGSPFERLVGWSSLTGPPQTDLIADIAPYAGRPRVHLVDKVTYTALTDEGVQLLSAQEITDLFICGIATDGCVLKTALDAFDLGYTPWVVADACASNATKMSPEEVHKASLMLLSRLIGAGQIIDVTRALAALPVAA